MAVWSLHSSVSILARVAGGVLLATSLAAAPATGAEPASAGSTPVAGQIQADVGSGPDGSWLARARRAIALAEYEASADVQGRLQAPNRAHDLRAYFEPDGVRVVSRTAPGGPDLASLHTTAIGRSGGPAPLPPGEVASEGSRVEIRRPGLVEWYVNAPAGLEQGFTLAARPRGAGEMVIELGVAPARAVLEGDRVVLSTPTGRRLTYGGLAVSDAHGAVLAARFEVPGPERVRIVFADARAGYPVTIDPLLGATADAQIGGAEPVSGLGFFRAVSGAGDVNGDGYADVIVGADLYDAGQADEGAAFVFHGGPAGIASGGPLVADTQLEGNQSGAYFGSSVAGAGDVNGDGYDDVIVGAPFIFTAQANAACVFAGIPEPCCTGPGTGTCTDEGGAFVFHGGPSGVANGNPSTAAARILGDQESAFVGSDVAGAGDVNGDGYADVLVGADLYDSGQSNEGLVLVFHGSASGITSGTVLSADTILQSNQQDATLGVRVDGAGDVNGDGYADVIAGATGYDAGQLDEGAAFVFHGGPSGIPSGDAASIAATQLESNQVDGGLGIGASGAGDVNGDGYADVIVGAAGYDAGQADEGAAFVFHGGPSGIADGNPVTANSQIESDQVNAWLGDSVAGAGDLNGDGYADVVVGAPFYDAGQADGGAAFVYLGSSSGIPSGNPATAHALLESNQGDARFGSVAGAGDVNGDGYADLIVGAWLYDTGEANQLCAASGIPFSCCTGSHSGTCADEGAAFVYHGGAEGVASGGPADAHAIIHSNGVSQRMGTSVAYAGDVNGDGYGDVIVGAEAFDGGEGLFEGGAFVFHGGPNGIAGGGPLAADTRIESDQAQAHLGKSVAGAGDVNGDGYADVIVGAQLYDAGQSDEGAAFVFLGGPSGVADGTPATANAQIESNQVNAWLGYSVAGAGDVNGDGYADVIVGAPLQNGVGFQDGIALLFHGGPAGITGGGPGAADAQIEPQQDHAFLGWSVAGAGDVNGDGFADVAVGAPNYDTPATGSPDEGAVFVFHGSASGIASGGPSAAASSVAGDLAGGGVGASVASAGDVNGDGYADLIVGAPGYVTSLPGNGAAFVLHGGASGLPSGAPSVAASTFESDWTGSSLGISVAGAGDVNGDGYADVIVGAPDYPTALGRGKAFVLHGGPSGVASGGPSVADTTFDSDQTFPEPLTTLGSSVAGAGDVNGDGFADVIVGAPAYNAGTPGEGAAFVFLGGGDGDGLPVLPQQLRGDGSGQPVESWGSSESPLAFQVLMTTSDPGGRGRAKLEVESCRPGIPFGDAACARFVSPDWTDVGSTGSGVALTETIPIPFGELLARWRVRALYAPFGVTQPGITPPPNPAHGPWRRLAAGSRESAVRRQMWAEAAVTSGTSVGASVLGGVGTYGGVEIEFADTTGGTLSVQFVPASEEDLDALLPGVVDFEPGSDPVQVWEVDYDGGFSGGVTLTFQYDEDALTVAETALVVQHYAAGGWSALAPIAQDTAADTITVTTPSLSPFVLPEPGVPGSLAGGLLLLGLLVRRRSRPRATSGPEPRRHRIARSEVTP